MIIIVAGFFYEVKPLIIFYKAISDRLLLL